MAPFDRVGWARLIAANRALPLLVRVQVLTPLTFSTVFALGMLVPLPPGPLCDEGMVLFMEGGCDWGASNIFFYSKVGLLLAGNLAFAVCARAPAEALRGFYLHLAILLAIALLTLSGGGCDTYYDHPNGSIGQMVVEAMAFSVLGLGILPLVQGRSALVVLAALATWDATHVGTFYSWLAVTNHWTWLHTALISATFLVLAFTAEAVYRKWRSPAPAQAFLSLPAGLIAGGIGVLAMLVFECSLSAS